ncbi:MAG TPA: ribonuclease Y, partial [Candidatus Saccharimonadales bacterium]|nr:ribonuclease Y [Candidatus Saccharimonadales bacterium]
MIEGLIAAIVGVLFGVGGTVVYEKRREAAGKSAIEKEMAKAKTKASDIVLKAKDEALSLENERRKEWKKTENRLAERETTLD